MVEHIHRQSASFLKINDPSDLNDIPISRFGCLCKGAYLMNDRQTKSQDTSVSNTGFSTATGKIDYTLMNDYMFHRVMERNQNVLKGLLCALLHLEPADILSLVILNPINTGSVIGNKDYYLDIKISLNDHSFINLELQVRNEHNWPERSLVYLCRLFDNLHTGDDYIEVKPACHIGILDFTLFPEQAEFYATYKLLNEKNLHKYSDKFTLCVLDLTQIQMATGEDKAYGLDRWAKLFKATTWEEFKMIAADDKTMQEAGETVFKLNWTDSERYMCEAREEARRSWNTLHRLLANAEAELAEKDAAIAAKDAVIAQLQEKIDQMSSDNTLSQ